MKRGSTIFLQAVILLLGVGVFALLLWEPNLEGRNVNATLFEIYFKDPFLAYIYLAFVPFFVGIYQAFKMLGYARRDEVFSPRAVLALRTIKYCAIAVVNAQYLMIRKARTERWENIPFRWAYPNILNAW